jgi:serine/alanine adding enzyme
MTELEEVPSHGWDLLLDELQLTDVYLRLGYVQTTRILEPGAPVLLHLASNGGSVAFPLLLREIPDAEEMHDVITPYGYGGPVGIGRPPWAEFHAAYGRWCERRNVVSTFIRYHPLYANHRDVAPETIVEPLAGTVGWTLTPGADLFPEMHPHHRRLARKAENAGVRVTATCVPATLERFEAMYRKTMERRDAASFYFFSPEYWKALTERVGELIVLFEARLGEEPVGSLLCFASKPWLHYHLGASTDLARSMGANNLLFLEAARWGQQEGFNTFHLGGGVGGAHDSLLEFKLRFQTGGMRPSFIGKQINKLSAYRRLAGKESRDEFFPAYRRPRSSSTSTDEAGHRLVDRGLG